MHFIVKRPVLITLVFIGKGEEYLPINRYLNRFFIPFQRIHMKSGGAVRNVGGIGLLGADDMIIFFAMNRTMNVSLVKSHMFHDIDLAIIRRFFHVFRQRRYSGPLTPA